MEPGWEYLHSLFENSTQATNGIGLRKSEGWLVSEIDVTRNDYIGASFRRRIFHSPGWYIVTAYGLVQEEEQGPFRTEELARKAANAHYIVSVKSYDLDRPWEVGDRFSNMVDRFNV